MNRNAICRIAYEKSNEPKMIMSRNHKKSIMLSNHRIENEMKVKNKVRMVVKTFIIISVFNNILVIK